MPTVLILAGCPHATTTNYRCIHLQEQLLANGYQAVVQTWREDLRLEYVAQDHTALVLQRVPMNAQVRRLIEQMHSQGNPVIFDTDDLVFEPSMTQWHRGVKNLSVADQALYHEGVQRYLATLEASDFVLTATPLLAELAQRRGKPAFVHRNALGQEMQTLADQLYTARQQRPASEQVIIGYGSGTPTHDVDFAEATPALIDLMTRYPNVELWIGGPLQLPSALLGFGVRVRRLGLSDWRGWFEAMSHLDINLAPLEQGNLFCRAKSEIKFVEAGALGVPTVASRIDPFVHAIRPGENGYLAGHTGEWLQTLELLINQPTLRAQVGAAARQSVIQAYSPPARAQDLTQLLPLIFNPQPATQVHPVVMTTTQPNVHDRPTQLKLTALDPAIVDTSTNAGDVPLVLNWLVSEPSRGSGGHMNLFRMIKHLVEFGHECHIYLLPFHEMFDYTPAQIHEFVDQHFVATGAHFHLWRGQLQAADASIATYWRTVPELAKAANPGKGYYFVQDFEPYFYAMGSDYIRAENTYRAGLHCLTLGAWLTKLLREQYQATADPFDFALDPAIYYPQPVARSTAPRVAFYARPSTPRRAYEIGIEALALVKARAPETEIIFYGANELTPYPTFAFSNLGITHDYALASLYASCDVGLVLSLTNPSLVPFEMMACRCAVVDIRSERVRGLIEDGVTGRLAEPTPEALADAVLQLLWDKPLRQQIVERAYARVKDSNWQRSARQVEAVLLRHAPPPDQRQQQRRRTVDGVDALVWQIQQLLDAESDNSAQIDQLRALLNQTLVEKAQLYRQLQQAEDAYNRLYVQQQAAPLQKLKQVAVQTAYEQTPVWHLGNAALSKVLLTPEPLWQTFTADDAPLCRIELLFARHSAYHGGAIHFVLYEITPEPRLISEQLLPSAAIQPDSPFAIDFPPQTAAIGRSYRFGLTPVDGAGETQYALWRFWSPQHRNAQLQQNEQPVHGQLAFQLFYGQPPACQPGTSGPAAWGQTIRFRATTLQAATVAKASEGVRLTQKAQQLVRQHGIAGLVGESVRYIQWRLMQWQKLGK